MQRTIGLAMLLVLLTMAVGCSKSEPEPPPQAPATHTLFQQPIRDLGRARGVQQTLDAADRRERRAIGRESR
ncbi:hypothetical protein BMS3Bbin12_00362 [bacterium BMS3Bbin12]|nr:hypothetical protein BMS3Abin12_02125 [bacterium BMS3Abin12]GBE47207.1 hypothetical protein BMS3Bbin12_00362 [bacterium BMS3Bbin12]GBE49622.1 hypothetical protein BMS3Bbin13_00542 [bacterium BMS3Bbin13]